MNGQQKNICQLKDCLTTTFKLDNANLPMKKDELVGLYVQECEKAEKLKEIYLVDSWRDLVTTCLTPESAAAPAPSVTPTLAPPTRRSDNGDFTYLYGLGSTEPPPRHSSVPASLQSCPRA